MQITSESVRVSHKYGEAKEEVCNSAFHLIGTYKSLVAIFGKMRHDRSIGFLYCFDFIVYNAARPVFKDLCFQFV